MRKTYNCSSFCLDEQSTLIVEYDRDWYTMARGLNPVWFYKLIFIGNYSYNGIIEKLWQKLYDQGSHFTEKVSQSMHWCMWLAVCALYFIQYCFRDQYGAMACVDYKEMRILRAFIVDSGTASNDCWVGTTESTVLLISL